MEPRNAHAHVQLGFILAGLHRYDEAVVALQRARTLGEADNWLEFGLAFHLARAGRTEEALEAGRAAVTRVPEGFHQRMALGFAELYAGRYAEAAANFERADRVFSHYEVLKAGWGDALVALGRPLEALAKYEDAIFENKRLGEAWRGMGVALTKLGRAEEALAKFEQAVAVDPNDPATYRAWADTLAGLGEHIEAEAKRKTGDDLARLNAAPTAKNAKSAIA
jgi:tetratricopeptide (TPR) repeat protein